MKSMLWFYLLSSLLASCCLIIAACCLLSCLLTCLLACPFYIKTSAFELRTNADVWGSCLSSDFYSNQKYFISDNLHFVLNQTIFDLDLFQKELHKNYVTIWPKDFLSLVLFQIEWVMPLWKSRKSLFLYRFSVRNDSIRAWKWFGTCMNVHDQVYWFEFKNGAPGLLFGAPGHVLVPVGTVLPFEMFFFYVPIS